MKKENMKKQFWSPLGTAVQFAPLSRSLLSFSGLTRESSQTNLPCLSLDPRVKPEGDSRCEVKPENNVIKKEPENDSNKIVFKNDNMARSGGGNMKRTYTTAVLTLFSVFLFSSVANAACYDKTCTDMGYTFTSGDCDPAGGIVKCPFDTSKVFCEAKPLDCKVGDIYYSDGSCAEGIVSGKTAVGVVGYVNGSHGFAISLTQTTGRWSTPGYNNFSCISNLTHEEASKDLDGKAYTDCIMREKVLTNTYPAADYCYNLKPVSSGKGSKGWYLPAAGELVAMTPNQEIINKSLAIVSNDNPFDRWYWSSTETNYPLDSGVFSVDSSSGTLASDGKTISIRNIRCLLAI